jgi:hypothetical protein
MMLLEVVSNRLDKPATLVAADIGFEGPGQKQSRTTGHAPSPSTPRSGADGCPGRALFLSRPINFASSLRKLTRSFSIVLV